MATRGQPTFWETLTGKGHQMGGLIDYLGTGGNKNRNVEAYEAQQQQREQASQVENASGDINASRPMETAGTSIVNPQENKFTIPANLPQSGIPGPTNVIPGARPIQQTT